MSWQRPSQDIPDLFHHRWRFGDQRTARITGTQRPPAHVGAAKPTQVVQIRSGRFKHAYRPWQGDDVNATIPRETRNRPWQGYWVPESAWEELPNVLEVSLSQGFDAAGATVATIQVENIGYPEQTGQLGDIYHLVDAGFLSPYRGYRANGRPSSASKNEWYGLLAGAAQIRVWQGYGPPELDDDEIPRDGGENGAWTFNGLVDDVDPESLPYRLTITARAGKTLTDQRIFGWSKSRGIKDPIVFVDRKEADDATLEGGGATASSHRDGHPARFVCDQESSTKWLSRTIAPLDYETHDPLEWVEIRLPAGRYEEIILDPAYDGMEAFIGVYVRDRLGASVGPGNAPNEEEGGASWTPPTVDGKQVNQGWLGDELVPNQNWTYLRRIRRLSSKQNSQRLGAAIQTGDNTILRVGFRRMAKVQGGYRAGVVRLQARKLRRKKKEAERANLIVVDDVADVVKVCLRWAGYDEWDVQSTGVRLKGRAVFNRSSYLIDPINKAVEQTGYVFFIGDPADGDSLGVPTFRRNSAIETLQDVRQIRDTELLTGIKVKVSEEPLAYIIRVRGKAADPGPRNRDGIKLGGDKTTRIMAVYRPPWWERNRLAGVLKHVTHTENALRNFEECLIACYLIALNEVLQHVTATVEIPTHPGFNLDDQVGVLDTGTGMNTRMWITNRASTFHAGQSTSWVMTLGGSMIDTPDLRDLIHEIDTKMPDPVRVSNGR